MCSTWAGSPSAPSTRATPSCSEWSPRASPRQCTRAQFVTEQEAALLLERSLLPARPPNWPGLEIAARYVSAESRSVGGDWYDLFQLPSGEHWVVIGDIAGHGLGAAVVMGRIRSALRAYALLDIPPEKVLELVDHKMQHFELGTVATLAVAVTRAPFDTVRIATAGHLPPILAVPGAAPILLPLTPEPLLGAGFGGSRSSTEFAFPPGALMAMYTDGLVERRGESLDAGLERLRAIVVPGAAARPHRHDHAQSHRRRVTRRRRRAGARPALDGLTDCSVGTARHPGYIPGMATEALRTAAAASMRALSHSFTAHEPDDDVLDAHRGGGGRAHPSRSTNRRPGIA